MEILAMALGFVLGLSRIDTKFKSNNRFIETVIVILVILVLQLVFGIVGLILFWIGLLIGWLIMRRK